VAGSLWSGPSPASARNVIEHTAGGAWDNAKKYIESGSSWSRQVVGKKKVRAPPRPRSWGTPCGRSLQGHRRPVDAPSYQLLSTITLVLAPLFVV